MNKWLTRIALLYLLAALLLPLGALAQGVAPVGTVGTSDPSYGISPKVSVSAESSRVLKASPGNLYSVYASNFSSTAGWLVVLNATTAPADGAILPLDCVYLPPSATAWLNYNPGPPKPYSAGIVAVLTSASTCFTKTTGTITGFISGSVQ